MGQLQPLDQENIVKLRETQNDEMYQTLAKLPSFCNCFLVYIQVLHEGECICNHTPQPKSIR